jgi:hypothetical protein
LEDRDRKIASSYNSRAYFADSCTVGEYDHEQYMRLNLLGKTMRYTTDVSGAGCGCNAALYLTSMGHNSHKSTCHDYYCDANDVCGESCAEIDIEEANQYAWHSTLHTAHDHEGVPAGYGGGGSGWNGPRDWTDEEFAPGGKCIDTNRPFDVAVSFPVNAAGQLDAMIVTLAQAGKMCPISVSIDKYGGMEQLTKALKAGMTPIVSYWGSDDMLWMDGEGHDGQGPCKHDHAAKCGDSVKFYDFAIEDVRPLDVAQAKANIQAQARRHPPPTTTSTTTTPAWWLIKEPTLPALPTTTKLPWWKKQWAPKKAHEPETMVMQKYGFGEAVKTVGSLPQAASAIVVVALLFLVIAALTAVIRRGRARVAQAQALTPVQATANDETTNPRARSFLASQRPSACGLMDLGAHEQDPAV